MTRPLDRPPPATTRASRIGGRLAVLVAGVFGGLVAIVLNLAWPHVGHDFGYFLPRLLDVRLHQLQEGWWSIQWWTPSFGAGLPAFANPQHTQFMPAQVFVPWFGPWTAAVIQAALFLALGVALVYHACRRCLGSTATAALVAAAAFGSCGFFWEHTLTGHASYNAFPLVALIPIALHAGQSRWRGVALLGLAAAAIIYSGGYTVIFVFALTALLCAWLLPLCRPVVDSRDGRTTPVTGASSFGRPAYAVGECWRRLMLGGALCAGIAVAKVVAASAFLGEFPRLADYQYSGPAWLGPAALFSQVFVVRTVAMASRWLPVSGTRFRDSFGAGEDVGYGPVVVIVVALAAFIALRRGALARRAPWWVWLGLGCSVWVTAEAALGRGLLWPLVKPLPLLRTLHENHRLTAAFALPVVLLVGLGWDTLTASWPRRRAVAVAAIAIGLTLASLEPMYRDRRGFWWSGFDASTIAATWQRMRDDPAERFPVRSIAAVRDDAGFLRGASSLQTYEPIFGYGLPGKQFRTELAPGSVERLPNQAGWRFHHPVAFVAPRLAGVRAFEPIPEREAENLKLLLERRQPAWPQPVAQRVANASSLLALALAIALIAWPGRRSPAPAA